MVSIVLATLLEHAWLNCSLLIASIFRLYLHRLLLSKDRFRLGRCRTVLHGDRQSVQACRVSILPLIIVLLHPHVLRLFALVEHLLELLQDPFLGHLGLVLVRSTICLEHLFLQLRRRVLLLLLLLLRLLLVTLARGIQIMLRLIVELLLTLFLVGSSKWLVRSSWHILVRLRACALQSWGKSWCLSLVVYSGARGATILALAHFFVTSLIAHWNCRIGCNHAWIALAEHRCRLFVDWVLWVRCGGAHSCLSRFSCLFGHWVWLSLRI